MLEYVLVSLSDISASTVASDFSDLRLNSLATEIIVIGGLLNPIVVEQKGFNKEGSATYHAAKLAEKFDEQQFSKIHCLVVDVNIPF